MEREEMVRILEEIIRDPNTNPTARVTAIRALKEFPKPPVVDMSLYDEDEPLPMTGPVARAKRRLNAER
jgi:hypothetical protein